MTENQLATTILDCAFRVHSVLGPGLLESTYEACLQRELEELGLRVERQRAMPLVYKDVKLDCGYRLDLVVQNQVLVEVKSVAGLIDVHFAQTLTYLKLSNMKLGLLINFNVARLKDGVRRVVNGLEG